MACRSDSSESAHSRGRKGIRSGSPVRRSRQCSRSGSSASGHRRPVRHSLSRDRHGSRGQERSRSKRRPPLRSPSRSKSGSRSLSRRRPPSESVPRRRRSRSKQRPCQRSRSRSRQRPRSRSGPRSALATTAPASVSTRSAAPAAAAAAASASASAVETCKAQVAEAGTRHNGDMKYQAEIYMAQPGIGTAGRARTMCVRGPIRADKNQAERDADQLQVASAKGLREVRDLAAEMKRTRVTTSAM